MALPIDFAVYAEHSPIRKKLQPGWNVRVFNKTEAQEGSSIRFDAGIRTCAASHDADQPA